MKNYEITVDLGLDVAYVRLSHKKVVSTVDVSDNVNLDLDEFGIIVGIECLELDAVIPFDVLSNKFHLHSKDVAMVKSLLPSLTKSSLFGMSEGTTSKALASNFELADA